MTAPRRLAWDACHNARDCGGLPTLGGGHIRPLALMRSDNHDRLTAAGQAALRASGASRIIDVRAAWEAGHFPSPFAQDPMYRNLPLSDEADSEGQALLRAAPDLLTYTITLLNRFPLQVGLSIAAIADAPAGGVVVHCHAGKDRTGLVVALALAVAGVPGEVIAQEYALSEPCLRAQHAAELERLATDEERERYRPWQHASPAGMLAVLDQLERQYGGVDAYLLGAGVTAAQLAALQARLTAPQR